MFNRSSSDVNISQIVRLINEIKQNIYKVIYLMMKWGEESLYVAILFSIMQLLQLSYLAFGPKIMYIWNNDKAALNLRNIFSYFIISSHLIGQEFKLYLAIFYLFFGLVVLAIVLFTIFAFTFKVAVLPLLLLKFLLKLFLTIGFLPMMLLFFGLLSCKVDNNGVNVWFYNSDIECWGNEHYIHGIFAIIGIFLFQILTSSICLIYFESKCVYGNAYAQRSGRPYSYYHINVFIIIMSYQLLEIPRFSSLFLTIYLISSFFLFYQIHTEKPFYNKVIQKLWSIITALNFWTSIMLLFAFLMEGQYFRDVIWGWVGGIPLITLIIINEQIFEVDLLSSNLNRAISGQQIIILCEYLLSLLDKNDQHSLLMLDGFIEIHKQTCYRNDCVLKSKKSLNDKNKLVSLQDMERYSVFIELISQMYYDGIRQFPQDVFLRLNYSYFLIDRLKLKQQALTELQQAEQSGPSFDHEFIIYRYKRIMEDDLQEQQQENLNQVDLVTEIAFQTQSKQLIQQIEKASLVYIDFWAQLQEEIPDIGKIKILGFKILDSVNLVQEQWNRLKRLNQKASKLNRLMGKYYSQVLNDEEIGIKLIQLSRMNQNDKFKAIDLEEIENECIATITILTDVDKIGTISNLNKAACSLLGYAKTDLVNRKLNLIQPDLFSKYHDHFLENFLDKYSDNYSNQQVKEKPIYVKNKQGYIMPCQLHIRMIQTINSGVFMCGTIKQDIYHKPMSIFLCQISGLIENINSTCIRMFGLELKSIAIKPINILDIFPDILERKDELLQKAGGIVSYTFKTQSFRNDVSHSQYDLEIENSQMCENENKQNVMYQCFLQEVKFQCIEDEQIQNKLQGYIIKFEKIKSQEKIQLSAQNKPMYQQCQFKFNCPSLTYVLDYVNGVDSQDITVKVDQSILWEDQTKISQQIINDPQVQQSDSQKNYAEGIKIVRLIGDRIVEIEESKSEEYEDEYMQSLFEQNENHDQDQKNEKETVNLYRSKTQLDKLLSQSKIPRTATNLIIFTNIMNTVLLLIAFLEYFINLNYYQNLIDSLPLISYNNQRSSTLMSIQSIVQDLKTLHYDQYPLLKDPKSGYLNVETQFRRWLDQELQYLIILQKELSLVSAEINENYVQFEDQYYMQNIKMASLDGGTQNYTFNEAVQSAIAKALQINSSSLEEISDQNSDVYFIEYNVFNSLTQNILIPAEYYRYNIISRGEILDTSATALLTVACIVLFILICSNMLFLIKIEVVNQAALQLFLDLDEKKIKSIYVKCENFITSLQVGDEDDDDFFSDNDENEEENENKEKEDVDHHLRNGRKKKKKFRNSNQYYKHLILALFIIIAIMSAYFTFQFVTVQSQISNIIDLIPVVNQTSFAESYYRFSDNALRKSFEVEQYTFAGISSMDILHLLITDLYNLDAAIHQIHSASSNILDSQYLDVFNSIFILTPCDYIVQIDQEIDFDKCQNFDEGVLKQGLSIGMAKYFESFRQLLNSYSSFNQSNDYNLTFQISENKRLNYMMNLANTDQAHNMRLMQQRYIKAALQYIYQALNKSVQTNASNNKNLKVALFISFNIFLFFLYFFIWIPLVFRIFIDMLKNRQMLTIIPLQIIHQTASIRQYIRKCINH